jgi:hypothetical protein
MSGIKQHNPTLILGYDSLPLVRQLRWVSWTRTNCVLWRSSRVDSISCGSRRILCRTQVVSISDDHEPARFTAGSLLRSFDRHTLLFPSAQQFPLSGALAATPCVISDVMMPRMSEVELHDRMIELGYAPPTFAIAAFLSADLRASGSAQRRAGCKRKAN